MIGSSHLTSRRAKRTGDAQYDYSTKQRISILPGGSQVLETARAIFEVQEVVSHKPN